MQEQLRNPLTEPVRSGEASRPTHSQAPERRRLASEKLFDGRTEIEIAHGDAIYRLRVTSLGKLILTK